MTQKLIPIGLEHTGILWENGKALHLLEYLVKERNLFTINM